MPWLIRSNDTASWPGGWWTRTWSPGPSTVYRILGTSGWSAPGGGARSGRASQSRKPRERTSGGHGPDAPADRGGWCYLAGSYGDSVHRALRAAFQHGRRLGESAAHGPRRRCRGMGRELIVRPELHDNGSGDVSREFRQVLAEHEAQHSADWPHCPEENGLRSEPIARPRGFEDEPLSRPHGGRAGPGESDRLWYNHGGCTGPWATCVR